MDISLLIKNGIQYYREEYNATPIQINSGFCEEFATDIAGRFGNESHAWCYDEAYDQENGEQDHNEEHFKEELKHCFIIYNGKFYDAERPNGVIDYRELPSFKRMAKKYDRKFPVFSPKLKYFPRYDPPRLYLIK